MKIRSIAPVVMLVCLLMVGGCGDDTAPLDATVTGPEDSDFSAGPRAPGSSSLVRGLDFQVLTSGGDPVPGVRVTVLAGGGGMLTDMDGNPLDPLNPTVYKAETDERGLVSTSFLITMPGCGSATANLTVTGSVSASVGVASDLWTAKYAVRCP